jgi:bifunctional N-acetylglucosamine-1-phosphate-uridyltransferase/glucosamine-1-phosphate-acetyltransferase GlmU-like protein
VGYKKEYIIDYFKDFGVVFVEQKQQLGTGHAVLQAESQLAAFSGEVLVLNGDMPLIKERTLRALIDFHRQKGSQATVLTAKIGDPGDFGRIVRGREGEIIKIVEKKDASAAELKINEINTGTFCFNAQSLAVALKKVDCDNAQREYYITDTIELLRAQGQAVFAYLTEEAREAVGVNTKEELAVLEKLLVQA